MLFDAMLDRRNGRVPHPFSVGAPEFDDGDYLGVATRGEGRFALGLLSNSPWDDDVEIDVAPEARAAVALAVDVRHRDQVVQAGQFPDDRHLV